MIQFNAENLLGKRLDAPPVQAFFQPFKDMITVETTEDRQDYSILTEGICFIFEDNVLTCVQFYDNHSEPGFDRFKGKLPMDLQFSDSRQAVELRMGKPEKSLDSVMPDPLLGEILPWVRYAIAGYKLTLRFSRDFSRINLVSIMI